MNSIILKDDSGIILEPYILKHIHETLKLNIGDTIKVTLINKGIGYAKVEELSLSKCKLSLTGVKPVAHAWFNLIVGLSRPMTSKKILEHATTFGASSIHFFKASLSEKSYMDAKIFNQEEMIHFLEAGLSQSALYHELPTIKVDRYNPASEYQNSANKFILDPLAESSFLDLSIDFNQPITLAIGPERGFINQDYDHFYKSGFTAVKISSSILRVEHAVYSAVAQLELLRKKF